MAILDYTKTPHPAGWRGVRVATTVGTEQDYRQQYFSLDQHSREDALKLARALNAKWRREAQGRACESRLQPGRVGRQYIARGLSAVIVCRRRGLDRSGAEIFYIGFRVTEPGLGAPSRLYRIDVHGYDRAFDLALHHLHKIRKLTPHERQWVLSRKPPLDVFLKELFRGVRAKGFRLTRRQLRQLMGTY